MNIDRQLPSSLSEYLASAVERSKNTDRSVFWAQLLQGFEEQLSELDVATLDFRGYERLIQALNKRRMMRFSFQDLPSKYDLLSQDPQYQTAKKIGRLRAASKRRLKVDWPWMSKSLAEHVYSLETLRSFKLMKSYENFMTQLQLRSSMSTARHYYYAHHLQELAERHLNQEPYRFIEVGAGAGNLAYFLFRTGLVQDYFIVDLPEMLLNSAYTIIKYLPDAQLDFQVKPAEPKSSSTPRFVLLTPDMVSDIPDSAFDVFINIVSFQEMDRESRDEYIDLAYRVGRPGALFFNVNRRQNNLPLSDGTTWDNNPLTYPYSSSDRVVIFEECPFHSRARIDWAARFSLAFMRAALIGE